MYNGFRYPAAIIRHVVWLYFRVSLSFRDIEALMASRGIFVMYETIGQWALKFGQTYATVLQRRQPGRGASAAQGTQQPGRSLAPARAIA